MVEMDIEQNSGLDKKNGRNFPFRIVCLGVLNYKAWHSTRDTSCIGMIYRMYLISNRRYISTKCRIWYSPELAHFVKSGWNNWVKFVSHSTEPRPTTIWILDDNQHNSHRLGGLRIVSNLIHNPLGPLRYLYLAVIAINMLLYIYRSISSKRTLPPPFFTLYNAVSRLSSITSL